ncbi:hypothetical protein MAPG_05106 [Magnaporthiopsis poae ATCC 64411]|uniref:Uncharacterized protein n=1 Tax=Magnaporthiopsis poae (strain ATCC 64411 / 73-15) TaxID=644358 RepID=A0A0C4DYI4_MAGP6|nr:hypothetical protein MAPG_05106 [Magnaporthiopsis poae ATCC 64411]
MPVTANIARTKPEAWTEPKITSPGQLLEKASSAAPQGSSDRVLQSGFSVESGLQAAHVSASKNGFVWAAYHAYCTHHHLVLRPDDAWFAILTQISFFINGHAEDLRSLLVDHEGQKKLETKANSFGALALRMADAISDNVKDPELRDWVMPDFSTTTDNDRVVGAVLFMGAMQKFFSYGFVLCCGIPSVTLLGEVADWQKLLARVDKLESLGVEPAMFARLLRPVLRHMVLTFEQPESPAVVRFWNKIVSHHSMGSGTDYLTGWLTVFCFWDEEGRAKDCSQDSAPFAFMRRTAGISADGDKKEEDLSFPHLDIDKITSGCASVPVTVTDDDDVYEATMMAGSVGIAASAGPHESQAPQGAEAAVLNTLQPVAGWWIFKNQK